MPPRHLRSRHGTAVLHKDWSTPSDLVSSYPSGILSLVYRIYTIAVTTCSLHNDMSFPPLYSVGSMTIHTSDQEGRVASYLPLTDSGVADYEDEDSRARWYPLEVVNLARVLEGL